MFDVGFWELALIGIVALLVVGPERLPALARTVGLYVGKVRGMVAQVRDDIEREVRADEIRKSIEEAGELRAAYEALDETRRDFEDAAGSFDEARAEWESSIKETIEPSPHPNETKSANEAKSANDTKSTSEVDSEPRSEDDSDLSLGKATASADHSTDTPADKVPEFPASTEGQKPTGNSSTDPASTGGDSSNSRDGEGPRHEQHERRAES